MIITKSNKIYKSIDKELIIPVFKAGIKTFAISEGYSSEIRNRQQLENCIFNNVILAVYIGEAAEVNRPLREFLTTNIKHIEESDNIEKLRNYQRLEALRQCINYIK